MSLGLLVYGDNHLILRGPRPTRAEASALVRHFGLSLARIEARLDRSGHFDRWQISVREFREDLTWAGQLAAATKPSPAVGILLKELAARGISIDFLEESVCVQ